VGQNNLNLEDDLEMSYNSRLTKTFFRAPPGMYTFEQALSAAVLRTDFFEAELLRHSSGMPPHVNHIVPAEKYDSKGMSTSRGHQDLSMPLVLLFPCDGRPCEGKLGLWG